MKQKIHFLTAVVLAAGALTASVTGCELIAAVDRSKINGGGGAGGAGTGGAGTGGTTTSSSGTGGMNTGGTGGSTSSTSSSGTGGACGTGMACTAPTDCPDTGSECVLRTCDNGCCGTSNVTDGTATTAGQTDKDCKKVVCDGSGATKTINDDTDVPDPSDDCHKGVCNAGTPGQDVQTAGTVCASNGGKVCDGAGVCVGCLMDGNCTAPQVCDPVNGSHTCVDPGCADGVKDGTESDKDCGGSCGATCNNGKICQSDADCIEGNCSSGTCAAATCSDNKQDGATGSQETDVDCGGPCVGQGKACAVGQSCKVNTDCATSYCDSNKKCATPTCGDGVKNGKETDVDCGGTGFQGANPCPACDVNQTCGTATDCKTGFCNGSKCDTRPAGQNCSADAECTSNTCGINGAGNCCTAACDTTNAVCGATSCAAGTGACQYPSAATLCGASCAGHTLTVSNCDGNGACTAGTPAACAGGFICASATACKTTCTLDTDCASSGDYCSNGACVPKKATGACTGNNQCTSGTCGLSGTGDCCTASCTTGSTCGATGCDAVSGACTYPTSSTNCGASCSSGQLTVSACNGSGTCTAGTATACTGGFTCASATACKTSCSSDTDCQSSSDYCENPGASGTCKPKGNAGATCGGNNQCSTGKCGTTGTGHCCTASCPAAVAACGATDCNTSGVCAYPGVTTAPAPLQTPGDCQKIVCNSSGGTTSADDPTDIPTSTSLCLLNPACQGPSPLTPHFDPAPTGTDCSAEGGGINRVCGDTSDSNVAGTCVECNVATDCPLVNDAGPSPTCNNHVCQ